MVAKAKVQVHQAKAQENHIPLNPQKAVAKVIQANLKVHHQKPAKVIVMPKNQAVAASLKVIAKNPQQAVANYKQEQMPADINNIAPHQKAHGNIPIAQ